MFGFEALRKVLLKIMFRIKENCIVSCSLMELMSALFIAIIKQLNFFRSDGLTDKSW